MSPSVGLLNGFSVGMNENWQRWGDHESGRGWSRDVTSVLEGGGAIMRVAGGGVLTSPVSLKEGGVWPPGCQVEICHFSATWAQAMAGDGRVPDALNLLNIPRISSWHFLLNLNCGQCKLCHESGRFC